MVTGIIYILKKGKNSVMIAKAENAIDWETETFQQLHEIIFNDNECDLEYKWQALHEMRKRNGQNKPESL
jgi:hypothetical protein